MLVLLLALPVAHAEDPTFAGAATPPEEPKVETTLSAELGGTWSTGNANAYAVNGQVTAAHTHGKNKVSGFAGVNIGSAIADANADGFVDDLERAVGYSENARKIEAEARYDRFLSDKSSVYVLAGALHDPFAGYDMRSHEQIGFSRLLVKNETSELRGELGADVAQELYVAGVTPETANVLAARLLIAGTHAFDDSVGVSDTVEIYENVIDPTDVRILNTAGVTSAFSKHLSLKLSHKLTWDNVPVEGFRPFDQTTMVTLVASLL